ncbi:CYTH domain-containing protein [Paenibacillus aurantius]|uniref:CYTH domain-containing protein n=1 Tax=Paenibacillus aurantius TaxID=2918900 RepID=A0AA96RFE2_9BACL|nr:CYTH domain-containing protein [Paenibacillus aurantius]WNQ08849.1 CYTH domain-containing protein [Paenibacillus aurantius]
MIISLRREAKYRCEDFQEIRKVLQDQQARYVTKKQQTDRIYKVPDPLTGTYSKRIKVRKEEDKPFMVYIYSRRDREVEIEFDYFELNDPSIVSMFDTLYGQPVLITKVREVWTKGHAIFHLDSVEGIGLIFEMELLESLVSSGAEEVDRLLQPFQPYLLEKIEGSNEDLLSGRDNRSDIF